jgi:Zn-dependent oligopeptidase
MGENTKILEEVLGLRQKEADLLGYANHAHYAQDMQMAKHPEKVKVKKRYI